MLCVVLPDVPVMVTVCVPRGVPEFVFAEPHPVQPMQSKPKRTVNAAKRMTRVQRRRRTSSAIATRNEAVTMARSKRRATIGLRGDEGRVGADGCWLLPSVVVTEIVDVPLCTPSSVTIGGPAAVCESLASVVALNVTVPVKPATDAIVKAY